MMGSKVREGKELCARSMASFPTSCLTLRMVAQRHILVVRGASCEWKMICTPPARRLVSLAAPLVRACATV